MGGVRISWLRITRALQLPCMYRPLLYTFLCGAVVPSFGAAYFYFLTQTSPGPHIDPANAAAPPPGLSVPHALDPLASNGTMARMPSWPGFWHLDHRHTAHVAIPPPAPGFTPQWLGFMSVVGSVISSLGVLLYRTHLQHLSFRDVFALCHAMQVIFSLLDIVIVLRWNVTVLGIPDAYFALVADDVMHPLIKRIWDLPFQIFAATALCPPGLEATVFSLLYACGYIGRDVGKWIGALVLETLGTTKDDFSKLWICIMIRSGFKLLPLVFAYCLIPDSSPASVVLPAEVIKATQIDNDGL